MLATILRAAAAVAETTLERARREQGALGA
jgi:hypothetical protein